MGIGFGLRATEYCKPCSLPREGRKLKSEVEIFILREVCAVLSNIMKNDKKSTKEKNLPCGFTAVRLSTSYYFLTSFEI